MNPHTPPPCASLAHPLRTPCRPLAHTHTFLSLFFPFSFSSVYEGNNNSLATNSESPRLAWWSLPSRWLVDATTSAATATLIHSWRTHPRWSHSWGARHHPWRVLSLRRWLLVISLRRRWLLLVRILLGLVVPSL